MSKLTDAVLALAEPVAVQQGCEIWDVEYVKEAGGRYLRVYIDKPDGVSIQDCENFSRALDTLPLSIESHGPVQYIVLMLGTNDCKADKTRSAEEVGIGMDKLIRLVIGMLPAWTKILLVAPPPLGASAPQRDPEYDAQSLSVSQGVAAQYQMIAEAYGLRFLDAGTLTQMSALDGEHLDPDGHKKLAAAIAGIIRSDCEA